MSLRLHGSAHDAERKIRLVVTGLAGDPGRTTCLCDERGNDGVERTFVGRHGVRAIRFHREADTPVVQQDAGARHDDSTAEVVKDRIDERHHIPIGVADRDLSEELARNLGRALGTFQKRGGRRRIALGGIGSSGKAQEVHDPANEKIIELLRSMANGGSGAVAV